MSIHSTSHLSLSFPLSLFPPFSLSLSLTYTLHLPTWSPTVVLPTRLFVHFCPSAPLFISVRLFTCPSARPSGHLPVRPSVHLFLVHTDVRPSVRLLIRPFAFPSICTRTLYTCAPLRPFVSFSTTHHLPECPFDNSSGPHLRPISVDCTTSMPLSCLRRLF